MLSCDWGTSSFRLRLVDLKDQQVVGEVFSDRGIADTYFRWKAACEQREVRREDFYLQQLQQEIDALANSVGFRQDGVPIIISGMVGASIGLKELPYASLPFSLDGRDAIVQQLRAEDASLPHVWLLSGVSNRKDVMRGEETQIIGVASIGVDGHTNEDMTYIFPGTHSKHIKVVNGKIVDFSTYMTGELFGVVKDYTILRDAIDEHSNGQELKQSDIDGFCKGVDASENCNLLHTLFSVRINQLFGLLTKRENLHYLSGLLIGTELRSLCSGDKRIVLCSGSKVFHFYELAMSALKLLDRTIVVPPDKMDKVVIEGQIKVVKRMLA